MGRSPGNSSLTRVAALTAATKLVNAVIGAAVVAWSTPIIASAIGVTAFGAWAGISRIAGFAGYGGLNALAVLRIRIGLLKGSSDVITKRRQVGLSLVQAAVCTPLILLAGWALVEALPYLVKGIEGGLRTSATWAVWLLVFGTLLGEFVGVSTAIVTGENLAYRAAGIAALVVLIGGAIRVLAAVEGFGLCGLAFATVVASVLASGVYWIIIWRWVPWFGIVLPRAADLKENIALGARNAITSALKVLNATYDTVLVGALAGADSLAIYAAAGILLRLAFEPVGAILLPSAGAGLKNLMGSGESARVKRALRILESATVGILGCAILFYIAAGDVILSLWMGPKYTLSAEVIALMATAEYCRKKTLLRWELVECSFQYSGRIAGMLISQGVGVALSLALYQPFGLLGIALGIAFAQCVWLWHMDKQARTLFDWDAGGISYQRSIRLVIAAIAAFLLAYGRREYGISHQVAWIGSVAILAPTVTWFAILSSENRRDIVGLIATSLRRNTNR